MTSNREQTLRLSQSALLTLSDSEMNVDSEDSEIYYIAEDTK